MMETPHAASREHLFLSYAYEQEELAMWLALKLSGEGYRVWIDQLQLLGGEPFPTDIDRAIRERTFRVISVISRDAIDKPNPRGERTLALAVGKALGISDFLIPIRADGISPEELNFQISDRTYIDFSTSWAEGFGRLIKKLASISAPKSLPRPREAVAQWYTASDRRVVSRKAEQIWTNVLEFRELPEAIYRVHSATTEEIVWPTDWPRVNQGPSSFVFELPPTMSSQDVVVAPYRWAEPQEDLALRLRPWVANLLRQYVLRRGRGLGLLGLAHGGLYFPQGLLVGDKLRFESYIGKTYCQVVGERHFSLGNDRREAIRYHLAIDPRVDLRQPLEAPSLRIGIQLYLTDLLGGPLEARHAHARRRRICVHWYNHEWLNRVLASASFLADGKDQINLAARSQTRIVLAGQPHRLEAPFGIDEALLGNDVQELPGGSEEDDDDEEAMPVA